MSRGQLFRAAALRHNASRRVRIQPGASDADARSDRGDEGEKATPTGLISIPTGRDGGAVGRRGGEALQSRNPQRAES